jgi:urea ABC transporter ATP-binding protein UrtE
VLLKVKGLRAGYGEMIVLTGVTLSLERRQIVTVLGRNGIGKTTLMKTLAGLIRPREGSIILDERDITLEPPSSRVRMGVAYVPQGRQIFPKLTVRENLLVGVRANRLPVASVDQVLQDFPALVPKLDSLGASLSGGQQQLLALARALVLRPRVLLLDEPSEGIQPSILDEIREILLRSKESGGLSVLLVEQNLDFAQALSNRAYVMDQGSISREVDCSSLLSDSTLEREFLGALQGGG